MRYLALILIFCRSVTSAQVVAPFILSSATVTVTRPSIVDTVTFCRNTTAQQYDTVVFAVSNVPNRLALLCSWGYNNGANITSVTIAGSAMTLVDSVHWPAQGTASRIKMYRLVAPAVGSDTVIVNWGNNGTNRKGFYLANIRDVNQTTPLGTLVKTAKAGNSTSDSVSVSTGANDLVVGFFGLENGAAAVTQGPGMTNLFNRTNTEQGYGSSANGTGGTVQLKWTLDISRWDKSMIVAVQP